MSRRRRTFPLLTTILVTILAALVCGGCDSMSEPAISATCSATGSLCQLPDGPIGVCQETTCTGATKPPCFKCTSQH